jgi:hypothetical protein
MNNPESLPKLGEVNAVLASATEAFRSFRHIHDRWGHGRRDMDGDAGWREYVYRQMGEMMDAQNASMKVIGALMLIVADQAEELRAASANDALESVKPALRAWSNDPRNIETLVSLGRSIASAFGDDGAPKPSEP